MKLLIPSEHFPKDFNDSHIHLKKWNLTLNEKNDNYILRGICRKEAITSVTF